MISSRRSFSVHAIYDRSIDEERLSRLSTWDSAYGKFRGWVRMRAYSCNDLPMSILKMDGVARLWIDYLRSARGGTVNS
jgi:hypothetical protein